MKKKPYKTVQETKSGRNVKSINKLTDDERYNKKLIAKAKKNKLPGYHVVKQKGLPEYLRSNPDKSKGNNLDPKISKSGRIVPTRPKGKRK